MTDNPKSNSELRKFGITIGIAFAILGAIFLWRGKPFWIYLEGAAAVFVLTGLLLPGVLRPVERVWMKGAHVLGIIMTHVILSVTFYLVITPVGLIMRLFGRDPLHRRYDRNARSYWVRVDPDGPTSRPDKPF